GRGRRPRRRRGREDRGGGAAGPGHGGVPLPGGRVLRAHRRARGGAMSRRAGVRFRDLAAAELGKAVTLPVVRAAVAGTVGGSAGLAALNAVGARNALVGGAAGAGFAPPAFDVAYAAAPLGAAGAVVLGVVAMSSEYAASSADAGGGRQVTTTLTAAP